MCKEPVTSEEIENKLIDLRKVRVELQLEFEIAAMMRPLPIDDSCDEDAKKVLQMLKN